MKKIVSSCLFLLAFFIFGGHIASAQVSIETFTYDLSIPDKTYQAGEEVTGSFTISNGSMSYADNVHYTVYLAGNIDEDFDHDIINEWSSEPFGLNPQEEKTVHFTYTLPTVIPASSTELVVRSVYNGKLYRTCGAERL